MGTLVFTVTRGGDLTVPVVVNYTTAGTGTNPVSADDHLGGAFFAGQITIPANSTTGQISIASNPDTTFEQDETGILTITSPTAGVTISPATAVYTFANDDAPPSSGNTEVYRATTTDSGYQDVGPGPWKIDFMLPPGQAYQLYVMANTAGANPAFRFQNAGSNDQNIAGFSVSAAGADQTDNNWNYLGFTKLVAPAVASTLEKLASGALRLTIGGEVVKSSGVIAAVGGTYGNFARIKINGTAREVVMTKIAA